MKKVLDFTIQNQNDFETVQFKSQKIISNYVIGKSKVTFRLC